MLKAEQVASLAATIMAGILSDPEVSHLSDKLVEQSVEAAIRVIRETEKQLSAM